MDPTTREQASESAVPDAPLFTFEEAVERVTALLGTAIRPHIYLLRDGELQGCLAVDPDVAFAALQKQATDARFDSEQEDRREFESRLP